MNIFPMIFNALFIILMGSFVIWGKRRENRLLQNVWSKEIIPLAKQISQKGLITFPRKKVHSFAENPYFRLEVFRLLTITDHLKYFPIEYLSDDSKSEAVVYAYFKERLGDVVIRNFEVKERIDKEFSSQEEPVDIFYLIGTVEANSKEYVFVTGPSVQDRYNFPASCFSSLEMDTAPTFSEITTIAHDKFLIDNFS